MYLLFDQILTRGRLLCVVPSTRRIPVMTGGDDHNLIYRNGQATVDFYGTVAQVLLRPRSPRRNHQTCLPAAACQFRLTK
jgi:hypothetical protein